MKTKLFVLKVITIYLAFVLNSVTTPVYGESFQAQGYCNPSLIQCDDGTFMVAFTGYLRDGGDHIFISTSKKGLIWNQPIRVTDDGVSTKPSLIQCQDGSYMIAYFSHEPGGILVTKSADGLLWQPPVYAYNCTNQIYGVSLIQCQDSSYLIAFKVDAGDGDDLFVVTSNDGRFWSSPKLVIHLELGEEFNFLGSPSLIQLDDGSYLIACVHYIWKGEKNYIALIGSDEGLSWSFQGVIPIPSSYYWVSSLIQRPDQSYMIAFAFYAKGAANVYVTSSPTWSTPLKVTSLADSSQPSLIQLSDGSYMIAFYGDRPGKNDIYVTTSSDGSSWEIPISITSEVKDDQTSSIILTVHQDPINPKPDEEVTVNADLEDNFSGIGNVTLYYMVDTELWQSKRMDNIGEYWAAVIPGQKSKSEVRYFIITVDEDGEEGVSNVLSYKVSSTVYDWMEQPGIPVIMLSAITGIIIVGLNKRKSILKS